MLLNLLERDEALGVQKSFSVHNSIHNIFYRFEFFIRLQKKLQFFSALIFIPQSGDVLSFDIPR